MEGVIDRFEGGCAVVEFGERFYDLPRELFPGAREGDAVEINVLGKARPAGGGSTHEIFERLREKSVSITDRETDTKTDEAEDPDGCEPSAN